MAIKDQQAIYDLVDLYAKLKQAQDYAASWANQVMTITAAIKANTAYQSDSSADEKTFVDSASTVCDTFSKAVPVPPDSVKP